MDVSTHPGRVERVSGPVVHITELADPVRFEYVEVGNEHLPGEIISVTHDRAVAQLYEYSGGLSVGEPAWALGRPLSVELGPGLLGGIYDGLLRPLEGAGQFLARRGIARPATSEHEFRPLATVGSNVGGGEALGSITSTSGVEHLVLVPPDLIGRLDQIAAPGTYSCTATIATVAGTPITMTSRVADPAGHGRSSPGAPTAEPFVTGQRVLDMLAPIARGRQRHRDRWVRRGQDRPTRAARQVGRRRHHHLRRVRRTWQRAGGPDRRAEPARRSAHRAAGSWSER